MDKGPWRLYNIGRAYTEVGSDDFTHDVVLKITGDFADATERLAYTEWLETILNIACCCPIYVCPGCGSKTWSDEKQDIFGHEGRWHKPDCPAALAEKYETISRMQGLLETCDVGLDTLRARLAAAERDAERWREFVKRSPLIAASCVAALDAARADGAGEGK